MDTKDTLLVWVSVRIFGLLFSSHLENSGQTVGRNLQIGPELTPFFRGQGITSATLVLLNPCRQTRQWVQGRLSHLAQVPRTRLNFPPSVPHPSLDPSPQLRAPPHRSGEGASRGRDAVRRLERRGRRWAGLGACGGARGLGGTGRARLQLRTPRARAAAAAAAPALRCVGLLGPPRSAVRAPAVRPPPTFPDPVAMGAARGSGASPRPLPLLSVLLLPLLGGKSRRAGGAGLGKSGGPEGNGGSGEVGWAVGAGAEILGVGARLAGGERSGWKDAERLGAGRLAKPPRTRLGSLSHPAGGDAFPASRVFPGRTREFVPELPGVAASRALVGSFFSGRNDPPHARERCGWWLAAGRRSGPGGLSPGDGGRPRAGSPPTCGAQSAQLCYLRRPEALRPLPQVPGQSWDPRWRCRLGPKKGRIRGCLISSSSWAGALSPFRARVESRQQRVPGCRGD